MLAVPNALPALLTTPSNAPGPPTRMLDIEEARSALLRLRSQADELLAALTSVSHVVGAWNDNAGAPRALSAVACDGPQGLVVGPEARWIIPPRASAAEVERCVSLVRYGARRRILHRLVIARLEAPGVAMNAESLIEVGWPGERMHHSAALMRVYSAIRRLRRVLGLEAILVTRDDGYLFDPNASVRLAR